MTPIRPALLAAAALLSAAAAAPAASASPASAAPTASVWTLSLAGGEKRCLLTLRPSVGGRAAPVAMPPGCHRAFPSLKGVESWSLAGNGLHLDDARGEAVLAFDADGKGFRSARRGGDALDLSPADGRGRAALEGAAAPAAVELAQAGAKASPSQSAAKKPAAAAQKPADVAGRYAVLRDKTRDTGCMVTLDDKSAGPGKSLKARLAPACRDQGIVIFDPVGWEMVGDKLVLTARKGHTTELETQEDGSWMNEVKKGKTLSLKRI